jgi:hypothetical protein
MESMLTNSGYGYGYGYGYGSGSGYGSGDGYGHGHGYGYGDGYGHGDGDGYGHGEIIGKLRVDEIEIIREFGVLRIGCQVRTIADWRKNWREIAEANEVEITANEVAELIKKLGVSDVE